MNDQEVRESLVLLRRFGAEPTQIEAKLARGGLPKSLIETLSAFANTTGGGSVLLGIDESAGFEVRGVDDAAKVQADLASMCDLLEPALRPVIALADIDGVTVVAATIEELSREQKPCYVKDRGVTRGSYLRVGDGDRRMTAEEVQQLIADRGQPTFDVEEVPGSTIDDLSPGMVRSYTTRLRATSPAIFAEATDLQILRMTKVLAGASDAVGTLGGVLALGTFPQQFFPQLNVTFVHYSTPDGKPSADGTRFLDNQRFDGPVPVIVKEAMAAIQRNMSRRSLIVGDGRHDVWDYPPEALREALVNAIVHRDLSPGSRGQQVQIEMYPDRLLLLNPGGLFGSVDIARLGEEGVSSSRNASLLRILEDVVIPGDDRPVCENRGSGVRAMRAAFIAAGKSPPDFVDRVTSFRVTMPSHALLDEATVAWLNALGRDALSNSQCVALAVLKQGGDLDNARYRTVSGVADSRLAGSELQDLVARELVTQTGTRGGARYTLSDFAASLDPREPSRRVRPHRRQQVLEILRVHGELSKAQVADLLNLNPKTAEHWLGRLKREGVVVPTVSERGRRDTRYRLSRPSLAESDQASLPFAQ